MPPLARFLTGRRWMVATAAALGAALWAAFTTPFTVGADIVTAIPLGVGTVVLVQRLRTDRTDRTDRTGDSRAAPSDRWMLIWIGLVAGIVGWELYCYLSSPRSLHPTFSSLVDLLDATPSGKFVAFLLWLALGWFVVAR